MKAAIEEAGWDQDPATERQVFLIGDAPPHFDYVDGPRPEDLLEAARMRRIVFHAIGCRSLPPAGAAFFRKVAYATEGSYQHIGRVRTHERELEKAVRSAVEREEKVEVLWPLAAEPSTPRPPLERARAVEVVPLERGEVPEREGACGALVSLPVGVALQKRPRFLRSEGALVVELSLQEGAGGAFAYALSECVPPKTPIRVRLGGAS